MLCVLLYVSRRCNCYCSSNISARCARESRLWNLIFGNRWSICCNQLLTDNRFHVLMDKFNYRQQQHPMLHSLPHSRWCYKATPGIIDPESYRVVSVASTSTLSYLSQHCNFPDSQHGHNRWFSGSSGAVVEYLNSKQIWSLFSQGW